MTPDRNTTHPSLAWSRRKFLAATALGMAAAGGGIPLVAHGVPAPEAQLRADLLKLLREWTDALLRQQINEPARPERHGAFRCPACQQLHGRCGDAVYPLLAMARLTGQPKYREAALRVVGWMRNVEAADGAWTNETDPKSWKGITVFAAIALAKSCQQYGDLLEVSTREAWTRRLHQAGAFIRKTFDFDYGNINYPLTATYALALLGRMFDEPDWQKRARELARQGITYLTEPGSLLFGEGHPLKKLSPLGCLPVDLGYNVEESLPALLDYADLEKDEVVRAAALRSLRAHLEFLLPDGGWDNSWGTRNFKWTYWGSRTSDGCLAALVAAAPRQPVFWTAAQRQLQLFKTCTQDGLLYGGPHLHACGVPPCVHHTFTHAKALADALHCIPTAAPATPAPLPRETARGLREYPEIGTWLAATGDWRATVTRYDWLYRPNVWHATGGALALLWHAQTGPLFAASLAKYVLAEAHNMQSLPEAEDFPLTPRVEEMSAGRRFSNLFDLRAKVAARQQNERVEFEVETALCAENGSASGTRVRLLYRLEPEEVTISAQRLGDAPDASSLSLVLPLVSAPGEAVTSKGETTLLIRKPAAVVQLQANTALSLSAPVDKRVLNLVPGLAAVPIVLKFSGQKAVDCRIRISPLHD